MYVSPTISQANFYGNKVLLGTGGSASSRVAALVNVETPVVVANQVPFNYSLIAMDAFGQVLADASKAHSSLLFQRLYICQTSFL